MQIKFIYLTLMLLGYFVYPLPVQADSSCQTETINVICSAKRSGEKRSEGVVQKRLCDSTLSITSHFEGTLGKTQQKWNESAQIKLVDNTWQFHLTQRNNGDQISHTYDYEANRLVLTKENSDEEVILEKEYAIKGPITDFVTLVHFFENFQRQRDDKGRVGNFYLLSSEPKLYDVRVFDLGEETLSLDFGNVLARKYQLAADLGPLTRAAKNLVPPTYVWYEAKAPYRWLKYQGLESGYSSPNIVVTVVNRTIE